jgi:cytochrome c peroxidase
VYRFTVPQLRGLAARAPCDGSAATLLDVVTFYNNRFRIQLSKSSRRHDQYFRKVVLSMKSGLPDAPFEG